MSVRTTWVDEHFVAGDAALDLANTVFRRRPEPGADLLVDPPSLAAWLVRTGVLPEDRETAVTERTLADARALRSCLWEVFDAQADGASVPGEGLAALLAAAGRGGQSVTVGPDGTAHATGPAGGLAVLALRAIGLVLHPPSGGVRACDRCGWFFVDSSRGRRRRWCSMQTCGNQAKAARYRAAHP